MTNPQIPAILERGEDPEPGGDPGVEIGAAEFGDEVAFSSIECGESQAEKFADPK